MTPAIFYLFQRDGCLLSKQERLLRAGTAFCHPGLDNGEKLLTFQVGAGGVIGKITTLSGAGSMDRTALTYLAIGEEHTGAVFPHLKGVLSFNVLLSNFTVCYIQVSGDAINIDGIDEE